VSAALRTLGSLRGRAVAPLATVAAVSVVGVALLSGGAEGASVDPGAGGRASSELRVGSKTFTESVILGEIVTQLARAGGARVQHRSGLGGTRLLWNALTSGAIDIYPEYTGTLIEEILSGDPAIARIGAATADVGDTLRQLGEALRPRGIGVLGPLGFDNTYAIGTTAALARRLGLVRLSDLARYPELRLGFSNEFMSRHDGWPAVRARYGLASTDVRGLDHDLAYRGLAAGAIDLTDLYTTDPEILRDGLVLLADDRRVFPRYDAVLLYRRAAFADDDAAAEASDSSGLAGLRRLEGRIDARTMASLNARAKLDHVPEATVAADFLRATLSVAGAAGQGAHVGPASAIAHRGLEHLTLVGLSLGLAIAVAIPLGILAARRPRLGRVIIGATGVVQTIPTLALLVFMIPVFGIGARPALVALFLYGLLPIVRNTHAGLLGIPSSLRESAEALGLPAGAILRRIELPLASPFILAGIKSAAVINVGTATLGALIGAGGFGQPIFTGIRLDDLGLILQGAVPASLLALLVEAAFDGLERWVVPRGLRLPRARPS
jgi:osmoprotectant transport system permease protein